MILAANQPYFFPYIGYWQLINAADVFLIADDCNFIRLGFVNRNRILVNGEAKYYRVNISKQSSFKLINETSIVPIDVNQKYCQLFEAYHKAPYFKETWELVHKILSCNETNLSLFLANSIHEVCDYLGINTKIMKTSDLIGNSQYKKEERIYDFCNRLGADTYINAIGGTKLYDFDEFKKRGIDLKFIKTGDIKYKQFNNEFVPNLSIIDLLMFLPVEEVKALLDNYTFISR